MVSRYRNSIPMKSHIYGQEYPRSACIPETIRHDAGMSSISLPHFLDVLETLAPSTGAAEWDNTGLLLEGVQPEISSVLLTLDLTPRVAEETLKKNCQVVISYHPPIFGGLDRLTQSDPLQSALLSLIRAGVHVTTPHTALDAAPGGLSDWLASCFEASSIEAHEGSARILHLKKSLSLEDLTTRWSGYLQSPYLRVSRPTGRSRKIRSLALCPGAGSSVLQGLQVDAVLTGEMKHHDVLAWQRKGTAVVLAEHGHTERPYLKILQERLRFVCPGLKVSVSAKDREPLELVLPDA